MLSWRLFRLVDDTDRLADVVHVLIGVRLLAQGRLLFLLALLLLHAGRQLNILLLFDVNDQELHLAYWLLVSRAAIGQVTSLLLVNVHTEFGRQRILTFMNPSKLRDIYFELPKEQYMVAALARLTPNLDQDLSFQLI